MPRGRFIVFEGLDGSGITTQVEYLRTRCENQGLRVSVTKEPTDGPAGAIIKWVLRHEIHGLPGEALALLFAADRQHHVTKEIAPALSAGAAVICDRYYLSSFAYQLVEVTDLGWLRNINSKCPAPDLTIYLDVPPAECIDRMKSDAWRGADQLQLYEELSRLSQVQKNFHSVIATLRKEGHRIIVIDATRDIEAVAADVSAAVRDLLVRVDRQSRQSSPSSGSRQLAAILDSKAAAT